MRFLSCTRCLMLTTLMLLMGWALAAQADPQPPAKQPTPDELKAKLEAYLKFMEGKQIPEEMKAKLEALIKLQQEKAGAQKPPEGKPTVIKPAESKQDTPPPEDAKYSFEMRQKPWKDVLEWLADKTRMAFIGIYMPTGTFTYIPPKGKLHTIPEIVDIINEGLLTAENTQKYILIRRTQSFTLVPASETIDPAIVPHIRLEELEKKGRTEVVRITVPLKGLVAETAAEEFKQMMSKHALVVALKDSNMLVLQDTGGSLQEILRRIHDIENNESGQAQTLAHQCRFIRARDAEQQLKTLLGNAEAEMRMQSSRSPFGPGGFQLPFNLGDSRDGRDSRGGPGGRSSSRDSTTRVRPHYVSCDELTNKVFVTGPADKIAQARSLLKEIDVPRDGQEPIKVGPPILKNHAVPSGQAEPMAKMLQSKYRNATSITITPAGTGTLIVVAPAQDQVEIARFLIELSGEGGSKTEVIQLTMDAAKMVDTLTKILGQPAQGAPYLEADATRNAIIARGTADQVTEVKQIIRDIEGGGQSGNLRIIALPSGGAAALADELNRLLPQIINNPINTIRPNEPKPAPAPAPKPSDGKEAGEVEGEFEGAAEEETEGDDDASRRVYPSGVVPTGTSPAARGAVAVNPQEKQPAQPGKKPAAPITITAIGDRLIIRSDDPEALKMAQELVRILTQGTSKGDFEVIRLVNASAVDAAKLLDEMYNGVRQQGGQQQSQNPFAAMFGRGGGGGMMPQQPAAEPRIRVVADPGTNALLIRATPVDMLAIRRHLRETIDSGVTDSNAIIRTWVMPPLKHANVTEVAGVLQSVYREFLNPEAVRSMGGPGSFGSRSSRSSRDTNGTARQVQLTIGVDDRSNSLVVSCSETLYRDVEKLVSQLEDAAQTSTKTVRFVPLANIDPALAQQAIDAIQGRTSSPTSMSSSPFGGGMSGRFGGSSGFPGSSGFSGGFPSRSPFGGSGFSGGAPGGGFPGGMFPGGSGFSGGSGGPMRLPGSGFSPGGGGPGGSRGGPPGGGSPRGGSSRGPGREESRGPDFFAYPVTDDHQVPRLFDPQQPSVVHTGWSFAPTGGIHPLQLVAHQEKPQLPGEPIRGPRQPVSAQALPELGGIIISGNNPADVEEILRVLELLQKVTKPAQVVIEVIPLQNADATSVTNTLLQLYSRINPSASGNITARQPVTPVIFGQQGAQALPQASGSLVMIPLVRHNAILVAAPEVRMKDIKGEIKKLDIPVGPGGAARPFALKNSSAVRVAEMLNAFYAQRYGTEQNQIRITSEATRNVIIVQAAEADLAEIRKLIESIDSTSSSAINELRVVKLNTAQADELANLLTQSITQGTLPTSTTARPTVPGQVQPPTAIPGIPGAATTPTTGVTGQAGTPTKGTTLRFIGPRDKKPVESGDLEDVRIIPDYRTNSLIIAAPARTLDLLLRLIGELDVLPAGRADVNVISLQKADASQLSLMLQQLFYGTTTGVGGAGAFGGLGQQMPLSAEGIPTVTVRIVADARSNSLIVAGSRGDVVLIEAIVRRLEDSDIQQRRNEVYHLRNSTAVDVANTLQTFLTNSLTSVQQAAQLNAYEIERNVIIVPEPISNKLLISATPRYFNELVRLIVELDAQPPQVVIQVLVAEVDHTATEEFGVELGLQSPVLFNRGIFPAEAFSAGSSVGITSPATGTGLVAPGVTVNTSNPGNPVGLPGYNFNNTGVPLGNNVVVNPGIVGFQGLGNLGVGRASSTSGVGGFVLSAASNSFNMLIRALKTQGRVDLLARPQIMTLDNQTAQINIGQEFPIILGTTITATGLVTNDIDYRPVGVILTVTPKISPDGSVLMRVRPEVSSVVPTQVPISAGVSATAFNVQAVETTVIANDGETVAIGGLIAKRDEKRENKIPWLGDLPYVGAAFRFRTHSKERRELLVILTPHIVRNKFDAARILSEESKRINWVLGDVLSAHGTSGMEPLMPTGPRAFPSLPPVDVPGQPGLMSPPCAPGQPMQPLVPGAQPFPGSPAPVFPTQPMPYGPRPPAAPQQSALPTGAPAEGRGPAPAPQVVIHDARAVPASVPMNNSQTLRPPVGAPAPQVTYPPATPPLPQGSYPIPAGPPTGYQPGMMPPGSVPTNQAEPRKETRGWNLFQRNR